MRRGDVVAVADRTGGYTGKPRPAVIVQSDAFGTLESVTVCPLTSVASDAPMLRQEVRSSSALTLNSVSWIAVDKITAVRRHRIGPSIGRLSAADMQRLNGALAVFLGMG